MRAKPASKSAHRRHGGVETVSQAQNSKQPDASALSRKIINFLTFSPKS